MPTLTFVSCGKCRKHITTESESFFSEIDVPYIECPKCGALNVRASSRNEWDLAGPLRRLGCYFGVVFFGTFLGVGGGLLLHEIPNRWLGVALPGTDGAWVTFGWICGVAGCALMLARAVEASRARMRDPSYVSTLKQLGLMD